MEPFLPVYRKPKAVSKKTKAKEYRLRRKAMGHLIDTPYAELTLEQRQDLGQRVIRAITKRRKNDPVFRRKIYALRALLNKRQYQLEHDLTKTCRVCGTLLARMDFETRTLACKNPRHECKSCRKERNARYYQQNKDKHKTEDRWNVQIKRTQNDN